MFYGLSTNIKMRRRMANLNCLTVNKGDVWQPKGAHHQLGHFVMALRGANKRGARIRSVWPLCGAKKEVPMPNANRCGNAGGHWGEDGLGLLGPAGDDIFLCSWHGTTMPLLCYVVLVVEMGGNNTLADFYVKCVRRGCIGI